MKHVYFLTFFLSMLIAARLGEMSLETEQAAYQEPATHSISTKNVVRQVRPAKARAMKKDPTPEKKTSKTYNELQLS